MGRVELEEKGVDQVWVGMGQEVASIARSKSPYLAVQPNMEVHKSAHCWTNILTQGKVTIVSFSQRASYGCCGTHRVQQ